MFQQKRFTIVRKQQELLAKTYTPAADLYLNALPETKERNASKR